MRQLGQALLREGSLSSGSNIQPLLHPRAAHIQHLILHSSKAFDAMYTHNHFKSPLAETDVGNFPTRIGEFATTEVERRDRNNPRNLTTYW